MVVLLGSTGYIGGAFAQALKQRDIPFVAPSRRDLDYTNFDVLRQFLHATRTTFLINAAGYTGKPNVDACETNRADTLQGNTLFPAMVGHACAALGIPFGHVSSGCIFAGAKVTRDCETHIEKDLAKPEVRALFEKNPAAFSGFDETDVPNFSFRQPPCSFYSGTKAMGEEALVGVGHHYIWRLRIPFDHIDSPRNYLSKLQNYTKVYDNINSLSHRYDFVNACLDLWQKNATYGIYNVTNPGFVTAKQAVELIQKILKPARAFDFWANDEEFYRVAAKTPRSNCLMDVNKMLAADVKVRPVEEALTDALTNWTRSKTV